jgi:hypothetical protein
MGVVKRGRLPLLVKHSGAARPRHTLQLGHTGQSSQKGALEQSLASGVIVKRKGAQAVAKARRARGESPTSPFAID